VPFTGSAWLAVRSTPTMMGDFEGYRITLSRRAEGSVLLNVQGFLGFSTTDYYAGTLPAAPGGQDAGIARLEAVSFADEIAFYANGAYLLTVNDSDLLGYGVGFGVGEGSTIQFEEFEVIDVSP